MAEGGEGSLWARGQRPQRCQSNVRVTTGTFPQCTRPARVILSGNRLVGRN